MDHDPAVPSITSVVINTPDEERLAAFWAKLLSVEIAHRTEGFIWLEPQRPGGYSVAFQQVADPTPGRRRLHLDTAVGDMTAATDRIIALGGRHLETHTVPGLTWQVMSDPDGNEFCITPGHHD